MTTQQPEALRLASIIETPSLPGTFLRNRVSAELRRQHARIAELEAQLATAQQGVQADAPLPLLLRDIARDLGITVPQACIALKPLGNYSTNSAVTAEMARMLRDHFPVPAHPAEGVPVQAVELDVDDLIDRLLDAQQDLNLAANVHMDQSIASASTLLDEVEIALRTLAATQQADGVPAQAFKTKVYQALGIGSACDEHVAFANIENLIRREHCLSAIEREFFMVETPPDEGEGDTGPGEECLLNWGSTPEQYVKQFAEAIAAIHPTQQGMDAIAALQKVRDIAVSALLTGSLDRQDWIDDMDRIAAQAKQGEQP